MSFAVVELGQIVEVIWVSLLAGVGITAVFSIVVLAMARSSDAHGGARIAYAALGFVALAVFAGSVIMGVQIMLNKSA